MPHTNEPRSKLNNVECRRLARSLLCSTSTLRGGCFARGATVSSWTSTTRSSETSSGSPFPVYQVLMAHNCLVIVRISIVYCSVADLVFIESASRSSISSQSGSGSKVLMTKNLKVQLNFFLKSKIAISFIPGPLWRTYKLQEKPSALKREHPALQKRKWLPYLFPLLWVIFVFLDLMRIRKTSLLHWDPDSFFFRSSTLLLLKKVELLEF